MCQPRLPVKNKTSTKNPGVGAPLEVGTCAQRRNTVHKSNRWERPLKDVYCKNGQGDGPASADCIEIDHPWISNDLMPIYLWTFPSETTDEELRACVRAREDCASRVRYHFAWVIDLSNVTKAPPTQRNTLAEHLKGLEEFSGRWNAGSALVVPSPERFPTRHNI